MYNFNSNNIFITKDDILSQFTQEELFLLVFDNIKEFEYITSPFREDKNPGCWFERYNDKLLFIDYGNGSNRNMIDCFEAIRIAYNLSSFRETLLFINDNIDGIKTKIKDIPIQKTTNISSKSSKIIQVKTRYFHLIDKEFWWDRYGISKENLIADKVFPTKTYSLISGNRRKNFDCYDVCYAFTDFEDGKKKLYFPYKKGRYRFLSTCKADDIGNINDINPFAKKLVITKSYKDCRVLRNYGINSIWFQNEGCIPSEEVLVKILSLYDDVIIFYDNDNTGINASMILLEVIRKLMKKGRLVHLPKSFLEDEIKDISDLQYKNRPLVHQFLTEKNLYEPS